MKRKIALLVMVLATISIGTTNAKIQKPKNIIEKPISPTQGKVHNIPKGSTIKHRNNITRIIGPEKNLIKKINKKNAKKLITPIGKVPATHIHQIPNKSIIRKKGKTTKVYQNGECILKVINNENPISIPDQDNWIEYTYFKPKNVQKYTSKWKAPTEPPTSESTPRSFLFNGIESTNSNGLIQAVLEWNNIETHEWGGRAWSISNDIYKSNPINIETGDTLKGTLTYDSYQRWTISIKNMETNNEVQINSNVVGTDNIRIVNVLEGENINENNDVPGDTTFYDLSAQNLNSEEIYLNWNKRIINDFLTGLNVEIRSPNKIELETPN